MTDPVSVIVPHYDDLDRLDTCLTALQRVDWPREHLEIVVADNASPCGPAAVEHRIAGRARLVTCAERGAGLARNAGVGAATHRLLAFTDSDCLVEPGWLAAGIAPIVAGSADLVGGQMRVSVRQPGRRSGAEAFEQVFAFDNRRYVEERGFTVTANLFSRRDLFDRIGGFRADVSEDREWCERATAAGFRLVYAEGAIVSHPARLDWAELLRKWRRLHQEQFALALERRGGRLGWLARAWLLPISIVAHAPKVVRSPGLTDGKERLRALATLTRLRLWRFVDAHRLAIRRRSPKT